MYFVQSVYEKNRGQPSEVCVCDVISIVLKVALCRFLIRLTTREKLRKRRPTTTHSPYIRGSLMQELVRPCVFGILCRIMCSRCHTRSRYSRLTCSSLRGSSRYVLRCRLFMCSECLSYAHMAASP